MYFFALSTLDKENGLFPSLQQPQVLEDYYHVSPLFVPDKVKAQKRIYGKKEGSKRRKRDEQLSDFINLEIVFRLFDVPGLFNTLIAFFFFFKYQRRIWPRVCSIDIKFNASGTHITQINFDSLVFSMPHKGQI